MCMSICLYIWMWTMYIQCLWRPEGLDHPELGTTCKGSNYSYLLNPDAL